ncbi:MAG: hypothetical protein ACPGU3_02730 [Litorivicinus sp.]
MLGMGYVQQLTGHVNVDLVPLLLKPAAFKLPRSWHIVDALPRNTMGKVQKNLLRSEYAADFTG